MSDTRKRFRDRTVTAKTKEIEGKNRKCYECHEHVTEGEEAWVTLKNSFIYCKSCWKQLEEVEERQ